MDGSDLTRWFLKWREKLSTRVFLWLHPESRNPDGMFDGGDTLELMTLQIDLIETRAGFASISFDENSISDPDALATLHMDKVEIRNEIDALPLSDASKAYLHRRLDEVCERARLLLSPKPEGSTPLLE